MLVLELRLRLADDGLEGCLPPTGISTHGLLPLRLHAIALLLRRRGRRRRLRLLLRYNCLLALCLLTPRGLQWRCQWLCTHHGHGTPHIARG